MTTFSTPEKYEFPVLEWDKATQLWVLMEDYVLTWTNRHGILCRLTIPKDFKYDKASVPRIFWPIARADGDWEGPSLPHDFIWKYCQHGGNFPPGAYQQFRAGQWVNTHKMTQSESNDLLEDDGIWAGASRFQAFEYRWAVQLCPINWFKGF